MFVSRVECIQCCWQNGKWSGASQSIWIHGNQWQSFVEWFERSKSMHQMQQISQVLLLHVLFADGRSCPISAKSSSKKMKTTNSQLWAALTVNYLILQLPLKIDIIKHPLEGDAKSTAIHAAILAPDDVSIYTYPNIPNYDDTPADSTVSISRISHARAIILTTKQILIFPSRNALHVNEIFDANRRTPCGSHVNPPQGSSETDRNDEQSPQHPRHYTLDNLPIKRAVFIDSTWEQSKGIYKDPRINKLRPLVLQYRLTQFWRHQKKSPRWFLATIEGKSKLRQSRSSISWKCFLLFQQFINFSWKFTSMPGDWIDLICVHCIHSKFKRSSLVNI